MGASNSAARAWHWYRQASGLITARDKQAENVYCCSHGDLENIIYKMAAVKYHNNKAENMCSQIPSDLVKNICLVKMKNTLPAAH